MLYNIWTEETFCLWKKHNLYYQQNLENIMQFLINIRNLFFLNTFFFNASK